MATRQAILPQKYQPWVVAVFILTATAVCLRLEGRLWWCTCGGANFWAGDPQSSHCSQHLLDPYFFTHMLHGVLLCGFFAIFFPRLPPSQSLAGTLALEGLWESIENSPFVIERYRTTTLALAYEGDSIVNSLGDIATCALGWGLARRLGWGWSIAVCVATELVLLIWIRDNLLLNVVMLAYPIEAIKLWQMGH